MKQCVIVSHHISYILCMKRYSTQYDMFHCFILYVSRETIHIKPVAVFRLVVSVLGVSGGTPPDVERWREKGRLLRALVVGGLRSFPCSARACAA